MLAKGRSPNGAALFCVGPREAGAGGPEKDAFPGPATVPPRLQTQYP
jgi:hypothetical protein